jgi:hypothetical protein
MSIKLQVMVPQANLTATYHPNHLLYLRVPCLNYPTCRAAQHVRRMQMALTSEHPSHHHHHNARRSFSIDTAPAHGQEHADSKHDRESAASQKVSGEGPPAEFAALHGADQHGHMEPATVRPGHGGSDTQVHFKHESAGTPAGRRRSMSSGQTEAPIMQEGRNFLRKSIEGHHRRPSTAGSWGTQLSHRASGAIHSTAHKRLSNGKPGTPMAAAGGISAALNACNS